MFFLLIFWFSSRYDIFIKCHTALSVSCKLLLRGMTFLRKVIPCYAYALLLSVWHSLEKSYRTLKNVIFKSTVWHFLEMSYRHHKSIWLIRLIPYRTPLHLLLIIHTLIHTSCLHRFFSSFCDKTCWLRFTSVKACWLWLFFK